MPLVVGAIQIHHPPIMGVIGGFYAKLIVCFDCFIECYQNSKEGGEDYA
jgi:hypothetical protein